MSDWFAPTTGQRSKRQLSISLRWPIHIINPVEKINLVLLPTDAAPVSLETYPFYTYSVFWIWLIDLSRIPLQSEVGVEIFIRLLYFYHPWPRFGAIVYWNKQYRDRILTLKLLPLTLDRELKDLVFFYKCLNGLTDLHVSDFVSFVSHGRTRLSNSYNLKTPVCKTSAFQASYFNRIAKLRNYICKFSPPTSFSTTASFRNFITEHMFHLLLNHFDIYYPCTWSIVRSCPCHP